MIQKHSRLNQIIKNCKNTQIGLQKLKNSFIFSRNYNIFDSKSVQKQKSISLLKTSRLHIQDFDKKQKKLKNLEYKLNLPNQSKQSLHKSQFSTSQEFNQQSSKFKLIEQKQYISKNQLKLQNNEKRIQKLSQIRRREVNKSDVKQEISNQEERKQQVLRCHLPNINQFYYQTFSPKNASLSQHSLGQKLLKDSILKQKFDREQLHKKYNKENVIKEYELVKNKIHQRLEMYRLNILKKISQQNVKKHMERRSFNKEKKNILEFKEKSFLL